MALDDRRIQAKLTNVEETLLIPLFFRAKESKRRDAIIRDTHAVEIVQAIDYDFSKFENVWNLQLDVAIRTEIFDERVKEFLQRHPRAAVINLGAGLDARFFRIDNGCVRWWDLDLPDAMQFREQFYQSSERNRFISASCFDESWLDRVDVESDTPVLIIAEGLFCYCEEDAIRKLFQSLFNRWKRCEIVFQSICPDLVGKEKMVPVIEETGAVFRWGIHDGNDVCEWNPCYRMIGQWHFIDRYRHRWKSIRWKTWLPGYRKWYSEVMKISQIELGGTSSSLGVTENV